MEVQIWSRGERRMLRRMGGACYGSGSATQIKNSSIFNAYSVKAAHEVEHLRQLGVLDGAAVLPLVSAAKLAAAAALQNTPQGIV